MPYAIDIGKVEVTKYTLDFDTKWSAFSILKFNTLTDSNSVMLNVGKGL